MKKNNDLIRDYLLKNEQHKRYLSLLLVLSMLVTFLVPLGLTEQADSWAKAPTYAAPVNGSQATTKINVNDPTNRPAVGNIMNYINFDASAPLDDYITGVNATTSADTPTSMPPVFDLSGGVDSWSGKIYLSYKFPDDFGTTLSGCNYVYYQLPENVSVKQAESGEISELPAFFIFCQETYGTQDIAPGYYYVTQDGYLILVFTDAYIAYLKNNGQAQGKTAFQASIDRSSSASGDQTIIFNDNVKINVDFDDLIPTLKKEGETIYNGEADCQMDWTITLTNPWINSWNKAGIDLNGYVLSDPMLSRAQNVEFYSYYDNQDHPLTDIATFNQADGTITFNQNAQQHGQIKIKYSTQATEAELAAGNVTNTAALTTPDHSDTWSSNEAECKFNTTISVAQKSGTADYLLSDGTYGKQIQWTINLKNNRNGNLDGVEIIDTNLPTDPTQIAVTPSGSVTREGEKYILSGTGTTATLTYMAPATVGENENTVTILKGDETDSKTGNVTYSEVSSLFNLDKSGSQDDAAKDGHYITWRVTVGANSWLRPSLKGYVLKDDKFANAIDGITVESASRNYTGVNVNLTVGNDNSITINEDIDTLTFSYKTPVTEADCSGSDGTASITNTVTLNNPTDGEELLTKTSDAVQVTWRNEISKNGSASQSDKYTQSTAVNETLHWQVNLVNDGGLAGKKYTDALSAPANAPAGTTHTLDASSIVIKAKNTTYGAEVTLTAGTDYTLTTTDQGFTVNFNNGIDYYYATITYDSNVQIPAAANTDNDNTTDYGSFSFENIGTFGDKQSHPVVTITRNNPEKKETISLTLNKRWDGNTNEQQPAAIQVTLHQFQQYVAGEGSFSFNDADWTEVPSFAESHQYTLSSATGWSLPSETFDSVENRIENGVFVGRTYYRYTIVETAYTINGVPHSVSGSPFVVEGDENGYYTTSYIGSTYPAGDRNKILTVTNTYHKTENITKSVRKEWKDADGHMPYSVIMELQRKVNNGDYEPYPTDDSAHATLTDGHWTHDWTALPTQQVTVLDNGSLQIETYTYRIVEVGYQTSAEAEMIPITGNSFVYGSDGLYSIETTTNENTTTIKNTYDSIECYEPKVKKNWAESKGANRPTYIKVQLYRHEQYKNDFDPVGDPVILSEKYNWQYTFDLLPKQYVDGNGTKKDYTYRIREIAYSYSDDPENIVWSPVENSKFTTMDNGTYTVTHSNDSAIYNGYEFTVTNTYTPYQPPVFKKALNKNGEEVTTTMPSSFAKVTIEGTKYYAVNWMITINKDTVGEFIIDTLPEGSILCTDGDSSCNYNAQDQQLENYSYFPPVRLGFQDWNNSYWLQPLSTNGQEPSQFGQYLYDENTRQLKIYASGANCESFVYTTLFPVDDLTEGKIIENTVASAGESYTASLTIGREGTGTNDSSLLEKTWIQNNRTPMFLHYTLDVNPDGRILTNDLTGTIDITDILASISKKPADSSETLQGNNLVDVTLYSLDVYEILANGTKQKLSASDYSYQVEYNPSEMEIVDKSNELRDWNMQSDGWGGFNFNSDTPVTATFKINYTANTSFNFQFKGKDYPLITDENGECDFVIELTEKIWHSYHQESNMTVTLVSAVGERKKNLGAAKLTLTVPDGRHISVDYMYQMLGLKANDKVTMQNSALLEAGTFNSWDEKETLDILISDSNSSMQAIAKPQIRKVDVNSDAITLTATLHLSRYVNNEWQYVQALAWNSSEGYYAEPATGGWTTNPSDALKIVLVESDNHGTQNGDTIEIPKDKFYFKSSDNILYRLSEIHGPDGYAVIDGNNPLQYCYYYGTTPSAYPSDMDISTAQQIRTNGIVNLKNNRLIQITATKDWSDNPDNWSATLQLYKSTRKQNSGLPVDAVAVEEPIIVQNGTATATWTNLPNGENGRSLYYYVVETDYTVGGVEYTRQEDGTYQNDSGDKGKYVPVYVGNAANTNKDIVVKNSEGMVLKKSWVDSSNNTLSEGDIPVSEIEVTLYGRTGNTQQQIGDYTLKAAEQWKLTIAPSQIPHFEQYTSFTVVEKQTQELYGYVISYLYNLDGGNGEITIINKDNTPTETGVDVEKKWQDGTDHTNDSVTISLYRSTQYYAPEKLTPENIATLRTTPQIGESIELSNANSWKGSWSPLPYRNDEKQRYYYYPIETAINYNGQAYTLQDDGSYKNSDNETATYNARYSCPVFVANRMGYEVTNYVPKSVQVEKKWHAADNTETTAGAESITLEVYRKPAQTTVAGGEATGTLPNPLNIIAVGDSITRGFGIKGDNSEYVDLAYPKLLENELKKSVSSTVNNRGIVSQIVYDVAQRIENATDMDYSQTQAMIIIAGTNDINHAKWEEYNADNTTKHNERKAEVINMIKSAYNQSSVDDFVVFLASIPDENFVDGEQVLSHIDYCGDHYQLMNLVGASQINNSMSAEQAQRFEDEINKMIKSYNQMLLEVVNELRTETDEKWANVQFVDINSVLDKDSDLADGVHPNEGGHVKMANAFADAIRLYYTGVQSTTTESALTDLNGVPDDLTTYEKLADIVLNNDNSWKAKLTTEEGYVYYVKEASVPAGWQVSYAHNGLTEGMITVTNTKEIQKTSVSVEKKWVDGNINRPTEISVTLYKQLEGSSKSDIAGTATLKADTGWKYTWENLDQTDAHDVAYTYSVQETAVNGYKAVYTNNATTGNTEANPIVITNTRVFSLQMKKAWADGEAHNSDTVKLKVHRSTNPDAASNLPLTPVALTLTPTAVTVNVGDTAEIVLNKPIDATKNPLVMTDNLTATATLSDNGMTVTVTGVKAGTTTLSVKDTDTGTVHEVPITVTEPVTGNHYQFEGLVTDHAKVTFYFANANADEEITINGKTFQMQARDNWDPAGMQTKVEYYPSATDESFEVITPEGTPLAKYKIDRNYVLDTVTSADGGKTITFTYSPTGVACSGSLNFSTYSGTGWSQEEIAYDKNSVKIQTNISDIKSDSNGGHPCYSIYGGEVDVTSTGTITLAANEQPRCMTDYVVSGGQTTEPTDYGTQLTTLLVENNVLKYTIPSNTFRNGETVVVTVLNMPSNRKLEGCLGYNVNKSWQAIGYTPIDSPSANEVIKIKAQNNPEGNAQFQIWNAGDLADVVTVYYKVVTVDGYNLYRYDIPAEKQKNIQSITVTVAEGNTVSGGNGGMNLYINSENGNNSWVQFNVDGENNITGIESYQGWDSYFNTYSQNGMTFELNNRSNTDDITYLTFKFNNNESNLRIESIDIKNAPTSSRPTPIAPKAKAPAQIQAQPNSFDANGVMTTEVTLSSTYEWTAILSDLPVCDEAGNPYYYWVEEVALGGYTATYAFSDADGNTLYSINATKSGDGLITVTNTRVESGSVMPSTGGGGLKLVYGFGLLLAIGGAMGLTLTRRRDDE